ncbi:MAG: hypothetical protein PHV77_04760 [Candidatus Omnitrophica bacterium]|nr:hypothetical protein [Candidatus Omnitrophota bacterium]
MKNDAKDFKHFAKKNTKKNYQIPEIEAIEHPEEGTIAHAAGCPVSPAECPSFIVCDG